MINLNREKTVAYSNRRQEFVNVFDHRGMVDATTDGRKRVDSSSGSEKHCLWLSLEDLGCGKTEEDSGKKDRVLLR